jgi:hypothetical protein
MKVLPHYSNLLPAVHAKRLTPAIQTFINFYQVLSIQTFISFYQALSIHG